MRVTFELSGNDSERELSSLYRWLRSDRDLREHARIVPAGEEQQGEMGGAFDAVVAVLSTVSGIGQLAVAYAAWRGSQRPRSAVTIVVIDGDEAALRRALDEAGEGE